MRKWFSSTIAALAVLALTSLIGALLKALIDGLANPNRLSAEVQFVPWVAKPDLLKSKVRPLPAILDANTSEEIIDRLDFNQSGLSDFGLARMTIENSSGNEVKNVNIRLKSYRDAEVVFIDARREVHVVGKTDRVMLPDMEPGDQTTVFVWGAFIEYGVDNYFKTFSSEGEFRLRYEWPKIRDFEYTSFIGSALDDYAWTVFTITSGLLVIGLLIAFSIGNEYVKGLLVSEELRNQEVRKFLADPKKFRMNYDAALAAWTAYRGQMKLVESPPKAATPDDESAP